MSVFWLRGSGSINFVKDQDPPFLSKVKLLAILLRELFEPAIEIYKKALRIYLNEVFTLIAFYKYSLLQGVDNGAKYGELLRILNIIKPNPDPYKKNSCHQNTVL